MYDVAFIAKQVVMSDLQDYMVIPTAVTTHVYSDVYNICLAY